jgi:hypothetical protein
MRVITIILILLVLGLYFYTDSTKGIMQMTGRTVKDAAKEIASSDEIKDVVFDIKNSTMEMIKDARTTGIQEQDKDTNVRRAIE